MALLIRAQLSDERIEDLKPLLENMAWQKVTLDETRKLLNKEGIICQYDNGGGQVGDRENPRFKSYLALYKVYISEFDKLMSNLPEDIKKEENQSLSVLDNVVKMRKAK